MKEQSHKAEMATALRGDFARLRARGVATTLPTPPLTAVEATPAVVAQPVEPSPRPTVGAPAVDGRSDADCLEESVPAAESRPALAAAVPEIAPQIVAEDAAAPASAAAGEPRPASSWLDRLRGR